MEQPPRDPNEPIVRPADLKRMGFESLTLLAGALSAYGYGIARYGMGPRAGTLGFTALVSGQILHAIPSRSEKYTIFGFTSRKANPILTLTVIGSLVLQGAVFMIPWLRNLLGVTGINFTDALVIGAGAVGPLLINESAKTLFLPAPARNSNGMEER